MRQVYFQEATEIWKIQNIFYGFEILAPRVQQLQLRSI